MVKVLFFAGLRERLGTAEHRLEDFSGSVTELRDHLGALFPEWQASLQAADIQAAVNQEMAAPTTRVGDGDEVAFFPPVTGG
ncbi:molybdopterin converting factor subunit 1 [Microbulbifer sp. YPW1]|uniref:molybdopterin converting factor subunit 1 n=1 Tax=Microbulbifer sp. YPW1 TaxID=2745199 RepID=UPI001598CD05|nr:molybdopterin converting factor subunit 1 [Microbulbifer sp. YPW1]QKX15887.1 molybdopterin converting factor subunit 1 [Microbulbifer sp. YPW1]